MTRRLLINGRFLGGAKTAVNAVAWALTDQLCQRSGGWQVEVVIPRAIPDTAVPSYWSLRPYGHRSGIAWEQLDLPKLGHEGVITGLFNTVPLRGRGYVTLLHDAHVFHAKGSYSLATRLWRQCLSRRAGVAGNHVLTVSNHAKNDLLEHGVGSPDHIKVVPNGPGAVVQACPDAAVLDRLGLRGGALYCVALSTLLPHKNIAVLLRAFAHPLMANVKLVLFGTASRQDFEGAGHVVPANVIFSSALRDAELAALYRGAHLVCMPSTAEGFGLPALEAMSFAKPVIFAPCGALPEVVGDAGLSAAPDDPEAWAQAISRLIHDPALYQHLATAAQSRAQTFTWDAAADTLLEHLEWWYPV